MKRLWLSVLLMLVFLWASGMALAQQPSAEKLIEQMASVYASCRSYLDEGEVRTVFVEQKRGRTAVKPFFTAFVRPAEFRFEFRDRRGEDEWNTYVIWRGAENVKTWWTIRPAVENQKDLFTALSGAAGVSSLASVTIPALLMPDLARGNRIKSLSDLKLIGEEQINGANAYRVEGLDFRNNPVTLWIDEASLLLVKTYEKKKFEKFEAETTTTFKPQVNLDVAQQKLAFNAPEKDK
jgi:hypothetical protein